MTPTTPEPANRRRRHHSRFGASSSKLSPPSYSLPFPQSHESPVTMSEAYERERQNNARLDELSAKVSALRGVTIDIYDNARAQDVIDNTSETFSSMTTQMKGSAGRLTRMAASGNKVAILKLSGIVIGVFLVLYYAFKLFL